LRDLCLACRSAFDSGTAKILGRPRFLPVIFFL
jgi:hypothetical protein